MTVTAAAAGGEQHPKKYIQDERTGGMVLSPEYTIWKDAHHSKLSSMVWVTNNDDEAPEYFLDEEGSDVPPTIEEITTVLSTSVIGGKHAVPEGVAVEELKNFNGKNDLVNDCPPAVRELLTANTKKNGTAIFAIYEKFVHTIYEDKSTRGMLGTWKDRQFVSVMEAFRDDFADHGIRMVLCKRKSGDFGNKSKRWIEFIDVDITKTTYVPQYDVANLSGQVIKTWERTLEFPNGVAVEELKQWKGRTRLKETIPIQVEKMITDHDLMDDYTRMVDEVVEAGGGSWLKGGWDLEKLKALVDKYRPIFANRGIVLHISHKEEYISHGQYGGHTEYYRWVEFVDPTKQPNYVPQRSADIKDEACSVM